MKTISADPNGSKKDDLLRQIGERIGILDEHLIRVINHRFKLANLVSDAKDGDPIVVREREKARLDKAEELANQIGLDPDLARALMVFIIDASVKHQTELRDQLLLNGINPGDRSPEALRRNLLALTESVAESYDSHQGDCPATRLNYQFEDGAIRNLKTRVNHKGTLLDLGTATGRTLFAHSSGFRKAVGIDISEHMLSVARSKVSPDQSSKFDFIQADLEEGIPLEDGSVSMVVMNNGTASDISNIHFLMHEVSRVLVNKGVAYFSFYNKDALVHESILPWHNSIGAIFNPIFDTLEVEAKGLRGTIPVFAKPLTVSEAKRLVDKHLTVTKILTFPFITSILPRELISQSFCEDLISFDHRFTHDGDERGAYITIIARKN